MILGAQVVEVQIVETRSIVKRGISKGLFPGGRRDKEN